MPAITNDWLAPLSEEFHKPYYKKLYETVVEEYNRGTVFHQQMIFLMRFI